MKDLVLYDGHKLEAKFCGPDYQAVVKELLRYVKTKDRRR